MKKRYVLFFLVLALVHLGAETRAESQFNLAKNRFLNSEYDVSLHEFEQFITLFPESPYIGDAYYYLGQIRYYLEEYDQSLSSFRHVKYKFPASRYSRVIPFWEGVTLLALGDDSEGLKLLEEYVDSGIPSYRREALLYTANTLYENGMYSASYSYILQLINEYEDYKKYELVSFLRIGIAAEKSNEILDEFKTIQTESPDDDTVRFMLAELYVHLGQKEEALSLYDEIQSADEEISAYRDLRELYFRKDTLSIEEFRKAALSIEEAVANNKALVYDLWELSFYYYYDHDEAEPGLQIFNKMRSAQAGISYAVLARAVELYSRSAEYQQAIDLLTWYMETVPPESPALDKSRYSLSVLYAKLDDWNSAMKILGAGTASEELQEDWQYMYTRGLYQTGDYSGCIDSAQSILKEFPSTSYYNELILHIARSNRMMKQYEAALAEYIKLKDLDEYSYTHLEYVSVLFHLKRYRSVVEAKGLALHPTNATYRYYVGLSHVLLQEYSKGIPVLEAMYRQDPPESLKPYILFYLGWAHYRAGNFDSALEYYNTLFDSYPNSETVTSAMYTAGWSAFSAKEYDVAAELYNAYAARAEYVRNRNKGLFMAARSLRGGKEYSRAIEILNDITKARDGGYWQEAYLELGSLYNEIGSERKAIEAYSSIYDVDPSDPDAAEGLLEAGKTAYLTGSYDEAVSIFKIIRDSGPLRPVMEHALYYWGKAYIDAGKQYSAILIWEKLIESFPDSVYVFEVLVETAETYRDLGELQKAADIYRQLLREFPGDASNIQVDVELDKLEYMIKGQSDREAALSAVIGRERGAETQKGREAIISLGQIYINNDTKKSQLDFVLDLLKQVIDKKAEDPRNASEALFLYGEHLNREGSYSKATEYLLDAALVSPGPEDFIAQALYKAAVAAGRGGQNTDRRAIIKTLLERFPDSIWAEEARKLQGGQR